MRLPLVGVLLLSSSVLAAAAMLPCEPCVIFGAGPPELRLIVAKLAAREGHDVSIFAGDEKVAAHWRGLMYGQTKASAAAATERVRIAVTGDALAETLTAARALVLTCEEAPLPEGACQTLLENAPALERIVLVSKMGVTRAKPPGPFGIGGEDAALLANERAIRDQLASRGIGPPSIIRGEECS